MKSTTVNAGACPDRPVPAVSATAGAAGPARRGFRPPLEAPAFTLPGTLPVQADHREVDAGLPGDGTRVMIVDDNVDAADTLADLLRLDGYAADVCYAEQQAIDHASQARPDIVILDIAMPERGGHALARELRALLPDVLLIAFTGFSRPEDIERSVQSGIDEHWVKPMSASSFALAMAAARARRSRTG